MAPKTIPLSANRGRNGKGGPRQKKAGWSAKWSDELKIGKEESAWIQITPGKYEGEDGNLQSYYCAPMFKLQFQNKFGGTSWGYYRGNGGPDCTLQQCADSKNSNVEEPKYGAPNRFFVNVIHYGVYARTPLEKDGKTVTYADGKLKGQPIYIWNEVKTVREKRQLISSGDPEDVGFFRKKFLELPATQFKIIQEVAKKARSMCKCGGTLFPSVFVCPECEGVLLDASESDMTDSEIANYGDQDIRCRHCGSVNFPRAEYDCDSCPDPRPHEYHEVAAKIKKVTGNNGYPSLAVDNVVSMQDHTFENKKHVVESVKEDGTFKYPEDIENLMKAQYDFEAYTAPKTNAEYSELLGLREGDIGFVSNAKRYNNFRG